MSFTPSTVPALLGLASAGAVVPQEAGMPTDEQIDRAIKAFDENWRKRPDITVKNVAAARRDAMRAALIEGSPPMNVQSPTTLDEKLWAAEAENKRLRTLVEELRVLASSREAREAMAQAVTAEAAKYAVKPSFADDFEAP